MGINGKLNRNECNLSASSFMLWTQFYAYLLDIKDTVLVLATICLMIPIIIHITSSYSCHKKLSMISLLFLACSEFTVCSFKVLSYMDSLDNSVHASMEVYMGMYTKIHRACQKSNMFSWKRNYIPNIFLYINFQLCPSRDKNIWYIRPTSNFNVHIFRRKSIISVKIINHFKASTSGSQNGFL